MESKKDLSCNIIRDLLPVYCDGMASVDSIEAVEQHFNQCEDCKMIYEKMSGNLDTEQLREQDREIKELKKVKKVFNRKVIVAGITGAIVSVILFVVFFVGVVPVNSDDVTITYQTYKGKSVEDGEETDTYEVEFLVTLVDGEVLHFRDEYHSKDGKVTNNSVYTLYSVYKLPFDDVGKNPKQVSLCSVSTEPFDESYEVIFQFKDKAVTYNLRDIAVEEGIQ